MGDVRTTRNLCNCRIKADAAVVLIWIVFISRHGFCAWWGHDLQRDTAFSRQAKQITGLEIGLRQRSAWTSDLSSKSTWRHINATTMHSEQPPCLLATHTWRHQALHNDRPKNRHCVIFYDAILAALVYSGSNSTTAKNSKLERTGRDVLKALSRKKVNGISKHVSGTWTRRYLVIYIYMCMYV